MENIGYPPAFNLPRSQDRSVLKSMVLHSLLAVGVGISSFFATQAPGPRSTSIEVMLSAPGEAKPQLDAPAIATSVPPQAAPKPKAAVEPKPRRDEMAIIKKDLEKRKNEALKKALEENEAPVAQTESKSTAPISAPVAAPAPSVIGGGGSGAAFTARDRYLAEIRALMEQQKRYPSRAKMMKQEGRVEIAFTVASNGAISDIALVKPSPTSSLNQATLEILAKIARFKPIPSEIRLSSLRLTVPVEYRLQ